MFDKLARNVLNSDATARKIAAGILGFGNVSVEVSIADRMKDTGGRATGFDYLRICLAVSIICIHSAITSYGSQANIDLFESWGRPVLRFVLPAFFALSGFLVAGSLERSNTLTTFLGLRVIRIYPALMCEVVLSALILGPALTTSSLAAYFSDGQFRSYLLNMFGDVHYALPGVFAENPLPLTVNGQLWTIPFELYCYVLLTLISLLGLRQRRAIAPIASVLVVAVYVAITLIRHGMTIVPVSEAVNGAILVASFLAGVTIYLYRDRLPWNWRWGLAAIVISFACLFDERYGSFFVAFPCAYATIYIGLLNPSKKYLFGADYSYGVFLYGFVIQQTFMHLLPNARHWYMNIALSVPVAFAVAAVSWHVVEKPAQGLRIVLKKWEAIQLGRRGKPLASAPRHADIVNPLR